MAKLTEERIINAIREMDEAGEKVTNHSLREHLGGGSFGIITAALRKYREEQDSLLQPPAEVLEAFQSHLVAMAAKGWTAAMRKSQAAFAADKAANAEAVDAMREEAEANVRVIEKMEAEAEALQERLDAANDRKADLEATIVDLRSAIAEQKKSADALQDSLQRLVKKFTDLDEANERRAAEKQSKIDELTETVAKLQAELQKAKV